VLLGQGDLLPHVVRQAIIGGEGLHEGVNGPTATTTESDTCPGLPVRGSVAAVPRVVARNYSHTEPFMENRDDRTPLPAVRFAEQIE
jgi:hypothetical protein